MLRWAIQTNLGNEGEISRLLRSCRELGCPVSELKHVPFSTDLPELDTHLPTVFYGATGFVTMLAEQGKWSPGVYFEPARFEFESYRRVLGPLLLNADADITTLTELAARNLPENKLLFVRPVGDTKEFAGNVVPFHELRAWVAKLQAEETTLSPDCPIVVAEPVGLAAEWRLFLVDKRVVTGSLYHQLEVSANVPPEVTAFAETVAALYSPARAFVLDLARSGPDLYVVEYNCLNSSGFYAADTTALVRAISTLET